MSVRADVRACEDQPHLQPVVMAQTLLPFEHGLLEDEGLPSGGVLSFSVKLAQDHALIGSVHMQLHAVLALPTTMFLTPAHLTTLTLT